MSRKSLSTFPLITYFLWKDILCKFCNVEYHIIVHNDANCSVISSTVHRHIPVQMYGCHFGDCGDWFFLDDREGKPSIVFMVLVWFDWMECFTTTFLHTHSWLNWVDEDDDEDEVGLKEKPEDTRRHWGYLVGGVKCPSRSRLQPGLKLWFPPDPRRRSKFLNLNWWKGHCYHYKIVCNNGTQGGGRGPIRSTPIHGIGCVQKNTFDVYKAGQGCLVHLVRMVEIWWINNSYCMLLVIRVGNIDPLPVHNVHI